MRRAAHLEIAGRFLLIHAAALVWRGAALFPMAAPAGGILLMIGWAAIAVSALIPRG